LANLTARNLATLVHTPTKKYVPTGNKRGRPRATEVIAKTNHKVEDFFRKKQTQVDRPMQEPEEEKKQEAPREEAVEFIDTSSNPQPSSAQQPAEVRTTGTLRVQIIEESKTGAFLSAKVGNPEARRVQMVEQMRKDKRREILSKRRQAHVPDQFQEGDIQYFDQEYFELSGQAEDLGFGELLQDSTQTVEQYLNNT
jgi:outer membrane biosynthesis protein TonB